MEENKEKKEETKEPVKEEDNTLNINVVDKVVQKDLGPGQKK